MDADEFWTSNPGPHQQARMDQALAGIRDPACIAASKRFMEAADEAFMTLVAHGLTAPEAAASLGGGCVGRLVDLAQVMERVRK